MKPPRSLALPAPRGGSRSGPAEPDPRTPLGWEASRVGETAARHHHSVYVVELDDPVWNEPAFRKANPGYQLGKPFVYVGMTGLDPDLRFDKHKAGIQANRFVFRYGLRLLPALYEVFNPMPYEAARDMEVELAIGLRESGYGVWQA